MKVSVILAPAFFALANAASFTNSEVNPEPGKPFTLTWSGAEGPVNIVLRFGDPKDLETVSTLVSGATGTSATITLDPDELPSGNYAFMIVDGSGEENYSASFPFVGNAESLPNQSGSTGSTRPTGSATGTASTTGTATATSESESESTRASSTRSTAASRTTAAGTTDTSVPGAAPAVSSPLALILVTVAAMFYFN